MYANQRRTNKKNSLYTVNLDIQFHTKVTWQHISKSKKIKENQGKLKKIKKTKKILKKNKENRRKSKKMKEN